MDKNALYALLKRDERLSESELADVENLINQYPYFQTARLLQIKSLKEDAEYLATLGKTSLFCADRRKLFYLVREERYGRLLNDTYTCADARNAKDRTAELLDTFLESVVPQQGDEETQLPQAGLSIVSTDYLSYIGLAGGAKPETQQLRHHDIIDGFIEKAEAREIFSSPEPHPANEDATFSAKGAVKEDQNDAFLTETLARIYIKQRKYEQALAIIRRLSLNFPKKSVYFADQIRFLEYLIINEKKKIV